MSERWPADYRDVMEWRDVPDGIAIDATDALMAMVGTLPEGNRRQACVRAVLALVALRSPNAQVVPVEASA